MILRIMLSIVIAILSQFSMAGRYHSGEGLENLGKDFFRAANGEIYKKSSILETDEEELVYISVPMVDVSTYTDLGDWYGKDEQHVYYVWWNTSGGGMAIIEGADPETFSEIGYKLGKDSKDVYLDSGRTGIDPNSMEFVDINYEHFEQSHFWGSYIKDDHSVYYMIGSLKRLEGADPDTFRCANDDLDIGDCHAIDKNQCYFRGKVKQECDPEEMIYIGHHFSKDKQNVYYGEKILLDADVETFRCLGEELGESLDQNICHAIDKNHYYSGYLNGKVVDGADPNSLTPLNWAYAKDDSTAYYRGMRIEASDIASFEIVNYDYAKDSFRVYYQESEIPGADPESFECILRSNGEDVALDKNYVYERGKRVIDQ